MITEIRNETQAIIEGYVNAVCRDSRILHTEQGSFVEQVRQGVFNKAIQKANNIDLMFNHDRVIGSTSAGTLELFEDNIGLYARAYITDYNIIQKAKDGKLKGWSFGFIILDENWEDGENGVKRRYLNDIELKEVSILDVTPAYFATAINNIEIRSFDNNEELELRFLNAKNKLFEIEKNAEIDMLKLGGF